MCLPRFIDGFCCCSLRLGALLVAWIFTSVSIVGTGLLTWLGTYLEKPGYPVIHDEELSQTTGENRKLEEVIITVYIVVSIFMIFLCICSFFLLLGIYKEKSSFMIPWQLLVGSCLVINGLTELLNIYIFRFQFQGEFFSMNYKNAIIYFNLLCFLIVYSYYKDVRETKSARNMYLY